MNDQSKYQQVCQPFEMWEVPGKMTDSLLDSLISFGVKKRNKVKITLPPGTMTRCKKQRGGIFTEVIS